MPEPGRAKASGSGAVGLGLEGLEGCGPHQHWWRSGPEMKRMVFIFVDFI